MIAIMNETKVLNFIDQIESERQQKAHDNEHSNSIEYKYRCLNKAKEDCKKQCLSKIFEKFYRDSIPLNDEYKNACSNEIKSDIPGYVKSRGYEDLVYYVGEAIPRCEAANKIMNAVNSIVEETFKDKEIDIANYQASDLVFKMDDSVEKRLDVAAQNLELDDLSQIISDNVRSTAVAEIKRAKREKEANKALEEELANDLSITDEPTLEFALELRGLKDKKVFQPSLFEGIMIGKLEKATLMKESGANSTYLYNALAEYGIKNDSFASAEEIAFVESVREYTLLNISKALKLENFKLNDIRMLAQEYATR
jgi:hypothetical protein